MTAKELMRPWEVAGLYEDERFSSPFVIKEPEPAWSAKKGEGWKESVKGRLILMSPSASSILSPQSPSFFPSTPHRAACHAGQKKYNIVNNNWNYFVDLDHQ